MLKCVLARDSRISRSDVDGYLYERKIQQVKDVLGENYPVRQTLPEQGSFDLGYYHQKQSRYIKKEDK